MQAKSVDSDVLIVTRRYPATPEKVFDALTTRAAIEEWFGPNDEMTVEVTEFDAAIGGSYRIRMEHQFGNEYVVGGVIKELDRPRRLSYSFQWEDESMKDVGPSVVTYDLTEIDGGTELTLTQTGLPTPESIEGHRMGWNGGLWRLSRLFGDSMLHHDSVMLALNRKLFVNALDGIPDEEMNSRISSDVNHLNWIAGHIANSRVAIANMLGSDMENPLEDYIRGIDDESKLASLAEIREVFDSATHAIHKTISTVTRDTLKGPAPFDAGIADKTLGGVIAFLVQHEAYHVGQMGLIRKALGHDATSYA